MQRFTFVIAVMAGSIFSAAFLPAQSTAETQASNQRLELDRKGETIVLEPYAPNILRVTLSLKREPAMAGPGYGILGVPASEGWSASETEQANVYQSGRIVATVEKNLPPEHPLLQTQADIAKYFGGSTPGAHITLRTPEGKMLVELTGW